MPTHHDPMAGLRAFLAALGTVTEADARRSIGFDVRHELADHFADLQTGRSS